MIKTRFTKLAALILALTLAFGVLACIGVSAEDGTATETAKIASVNVEHREMMHLAVKVEYDEAAVSGAVGIMVWESATTDCTAENSIYSSYALHSDMAEEPTYYYASQAIAAKNINTDYYIAVVEKNGNEVTLLSTPALYSVKSWAETKLTQNPDEAHANLYNKVLAYGNAASGLFN
ncbi:MAG: hypothetical protein IJX92_01000 [Clostridia bacterium]|nr:hypothetical protein [Clostridia bacterium]